MSLSSPDDNTPSPSEGPSTSNDEEEQKNGKLKTNQDVLDDVDKLFQLFQDEWKAVTETKQRKCGAKKKSDNVSEPGTSGVANLSSPAKPKSSLPKSQSPFAIAVFKAVAPYAHLLIEGKETSGQNKMTWDKIHADFVAANPEMDQPGLRRRMQVAWAMKKYNTKRKKGPLNEVDKTIVKAVEQSHAIIPVKSTPVTTESPPTKRPRKSTPRKVESSDRELDPLDALINNVMATTSPKPRGRPRKRSIKDFEAISDATTTTSPQPIHSATLYVTPTSPIPLNLTDLRAKTPDFSEKNLAEGKGQVNQSSEGKEEPESTKKSTEKPIGNAADPRENSNVVLSFENMLKVLEICRKNNYSYDIQQDTLIFKDNTKKTKDVVIPINLIHHLSL